MSDAYEKVTVQGVTLDKLTYAAFQVAQAHSKKDNDWTIFQGSYHPGVGPSGGTHDGGGAIDISPFNWKKRVRALRLAGFAAWHRPAIPGLWGEHIHCVLIGNKMASQAAKDQIPDYVNYKDGLAGHGPDRTWHPFPSGGQPPAFQYDLWKTEEKRVEVLRNTLDRLLDQTHQAIANAQNDLQRKVLSDQYRHLKNMHSEMRLQVSLFVKKEAA